MKSFMFSSCCKVLPDGEISFKELRSGSDESYAGGIVKYLFSFLSGKPDNPLATIVFSPYTLKIDNVTVRCYWSYTLKKTNGTVSVIESGGFALIEDAKKKNPTKQELLVAIQRQKKLSGNGRLPTMRSGRLITCGDNTKKLFRMARPHDDYIIMESPTRKQVGDTTFQELGKYYFYYLAHTLVLKTYFFHSRHRISDDTCRVVSRRCTVFSNTDYYYCYARLTKIPGQDVRKKRIMENNYASSLRFQVFVRTFVANKWRI